MYLLASPRVMRIFVFQRSNPLIVLLLLYLTSDFTLSFLVGCVVVKYLASSFVSISDIQMRKEPFSCMFWESQLGAFFCYLFYWISYYNLYFLSVLTIIIVFFVAELKWNWLLISCTGVQFCFLNFSSNQILKAMSQLLYILIGTAMTMSYLLSTQLSFWMKLDT